VFVAKYSLHLPTAEQQRKTRAAIHAMDVPMKLVLPVGTASVNQGENNAFMLSCSSTCLCRSAPTLEVNKTMTSQNYVS
jgi:hypothetical protein